LLITLSVEFPNFTKVNDKTRIKTTETNLSEHSCVANNCWIAHYAREFNQLPKSHTNQKVINMIQNKTTLVFSSCMNTFPFFNETKGIHFGNHVCKFLIPYKISNFSQLYKIYLFIANWISCFKNQMNLKGRRSTNLSISYFATWEFYVLSFGSLFEMLLCFIF